MRQMEWKVLLLDDNADLAYLYKRQIQRRSRFRVTVQTEGTAARLLAERQLFDIVVIDAKLDYRGLEFGGLRLADELHPRYGSNSILVISRFITAELMRERSPGYDFMPKPSEERLKSFDLDLCRKMSSMRSQQYVFVAMPFTRNLEGMYSKYIRPTIKEYGFNCVRADEVAHRKGIQSTTRELIRKSKLSLVVADGRNPNVYYEAGLADGMGKDVLLVAQAAEDLAINISNRKAVFYGTRPSGLPAAIWKSLRGLQSATKPD